MKNFNKKNIDELMEKAVREGIFPGAAIGIAKGLGVDRKSLVCSYGCASLLPRPEAMGDDIFFDLASLTKPLATTLAILCLLKKQKMDFDEPLSSLIAKHVPPDKEQITLRQLLGHCAGLPAWRPYFKDLINTQRRWQTLMKWILAEPLVYSPGSRTQYSDLGFMLLGMVVEKKAGMNLCRYTREMIYKPLGMEKNLFFQPQFRESKMGQAGARDFAATEHITWRGGVSRGSVHDDNCYLLDGVCGHAGLFGNVKGVLQLTGLILDQWQGIAEHPNFRGQDLSKVLARQEHIPETTWALGFDTPSAKGSSSGRYLSPLSVGHLGYTGTSFWIDPMRQLVMVLLTNRVHPRRDNERIKNFRPLWHDTVVELLL